MIYYIYNFIVEVAVCQPFYLINEYVRVNSVVLELYIKFGSNNYLL